MNLWVRKSFSLSLVMLIFLGSLITSCGEALKSSNRSFVVDDSVSRPGGGAGQDDEDKDRKGDGSEEEEKEKEKPKDVPSDGVPLSECNGDLSKMCYGGYDDPAHFEDKAKVPFKVKVLGNITDDVQGFGETLTNTANRELAHNGHKFLQLELEKAEALPAVPDTVFMDGNRMINDFGESGYMVAVLVKGMLTPTRRTLGYSPGLLTDLYGKNSIVVMDYDAVKNPNDMIVLIHELFHGFGAMHTTDGNGDTDNVRVGRGNRLINGLVFFSEIAVRVPDEYDCFVTRKGFDFEQYIEDVQGSNITRNFTDQFDNRLTINTGTLMFKNKLPNAKLFNSGNNFNEMYSNILSVYYDIFLGPDKDENCD